MTPPWIIMVAGERNWDSITKRFLPCVSRTFHLSKYTMLTYMIWRWDTHTQTRSSAHIRTQNLHLISFGVFLLTCLGCKKSNIFTGGAVETVRFKIYVAWRHSAWPYGVHGWVTFGSRKVRSLMTEHPKLCKFWCEDLRIQSLAGDSRHNRIVCS